MVTGTWESYHFVVFIFSRMDKYGTCGGDISSNKGDMSSIQSEGAKQ